MKKTVVKCITWSNSSVDLRTTQTRVLSEGHFKEEQRKPDKGQTEDVGNEKGPSAVHVTDVGEPPEVAEADGEAQTREEELAVVVPLASLRPIRIAVFGSLQIHFKLLGNLFSHFIIKCNLKSFNSNSRLSKVLTARHTETQ